MSLKDKRVLVTGAGGFIGSHLAERLVEEAGHVRAMVHYNALNSAGWLEHSPRRDDLELYYGDIGDAGSVERACEGVDVIFHLAALIAIPYSYVAPGAYVTANILGSQHILNAARRTGARVLQTSTSEVYGTARIAPIPESHPLQAQSPYAATKIGSDKLAESYFLSFGLPVTVVRPFNTFGPRQSDRAIIPTIIKQVLLGDVVKIGNTSPTRDLNYVDNTVSAFVAVAKRPDLAGRTIHFGSGREISIGDLARLIGQLEGKDITIQSEAERQRKAGSEVERLIADDTLVRELVPEWRPEIDLEEGLRRTIEWQRQRGDFRDAGKYVV